MVLLVLWSKPWSVRTGDRLYRQVIELQGNARLERRAHHYQRRGPRPACRE